MQQHVNGCPSCYARLLRGDSHDTGEQETGVIQGAPPWATDAQSDLDWPPGKDLGRYVILLTLGKGGMGVVFRAYDKELDRAVALKVLHHEESEGSSGGSTRLLREAQAMARLSHPNVVAVHDVVVLEGRVCVVMELVEGTTVREWLKSEPRPTWKDIVTAFRAAGEGLAAAHDAHLVHRDFKPDNVLVGRDGRIRVTDFGIARLAHDGQEDARTPPSVPPAVPAGADPTHTLGAGTGTLAATLPAGTLAASITQEGKVVGTPRYMAPEQFAQAPADFRTDQFSFAVTLYEALYGQLPFAGETTPARLQSAKRGEVRPPPSSSKVPPWVHRHLLRALSAAPEKRFASMRELTQALARDPTHKRNRRWLGAGVAAALVLALVAVVRSGRARAELCTGSERKLAGIWDEARREQVRAAFAATGLPFAEDSFSRAAQVLDAYTSEWAATHRDACEATSLRGEQPEAVLTLRMACLQQRLDEVAALTELFTRADPGIVGKAKQSLDALSRLSTCSDVARLTAKLPPPEDPKVAAEVERIRRELIRAEVLTEAGRLEEAEAVAHPALAAAEQTGYSPVRAEAELMVARVLSMDMRYDEAISHYTSAFARGLADAHDEVITGGAVGVAGCAFRQRKNALALEWTDYAESANQRTRDPDLAVLIHNSRGNVARNDGDFVSAAAYYLKGVEEAQARLGPDHMTTLGVTYNVASALQNQGRFREASVKYEAVIAAARRTLGPKHPFLAFPLVGSGNVAQYRGQLDQAQAHFEEVLALTGGKGFNAGNAHNGLSDLAVARGRYDEALVHLQNAQAIHESFAPGGVDTLADIARRGLVLVAQGKAEQAWPLFEDVLARGAKLDGAFDALADAQVGKAQVLLARGQAAQALPLAQGAVATLAPKRGKGHPVTLQARLLVADIHQALGQREQVEKEARDVLAEVLAEFDEDHSLAIRTRALLARGPAEARSVP